MSDNMHNDNTITELDLMAYADGKLDGPRAAQVRTHLLANPLDNAQVTVWQQQNALLRHAFDPVLDEPIPQRLLDAVNARNNIVPLRQRPLWRAAAAALLAVLCGTGGWAVGRVQYNTPDHPNLTAFLDQAATGQSTPFPTGRDGGLPMAWLSRALSSNVIPPQLANAGYKLAGHKLVTMGGQPTAMLTYRTAGNETPVVLYLRPRWNNQVQPVSTQQVGGKTLAWWADGPLVYALNGDLPGSSAQHLATQVRVAMQTTFASQSTQVASGNISPRKTMAEGPAASVSEAAAVAALTVPSTASTPPALAPAPQAAKVTASASAP